MGCKVSFQTTFSRLMVCLRKRGIYLLAKLVIAIRLCRKYLKGTEKMKPLYILAAALTALPVLATAEVRLYGEIKSGVEASRIKSGGSSVSHSGVYDSGSYVGLRGSLPIVGGNNVLFQAEQDTPVGSRSLSRTVWHSPSPMQAIWEMMGQGSLGNIEFFVVRVMKRSSENGFEGFRRPLPFCLSFFV